MKNIDELIIEPLNNTHNRKSFQCTHHQFEDYLQKYARQYAKRNICQTFVARTVDEPERILGYFTLSALSIDLSALPESKRAKLPKHPLPAVLIGRLARDKRLDGYGVGKLLLADAFKRAFSASEQLGIYALVVDAIDQEAMGFYQHFGFIPLSSSANRLFLPLHSLA